MLNDRDKVNPPQSQLGFLEFLVAPLVVVNVSLFPMCAHLGAQLISNMLDWGEVWVKEAKAPPAKEDIDKARSPKL